MTECERILREGSKSFALAARLLPRAVRGDVAALYAYLRRADDAVDLAAPAAQLAHVARLERELDSVYAGEPQHELVLAAFQDVAQRCGIPRLYVDELLAGMRMDATECRYTSREELLRYAYRVAGTVGLMLCHVFGVRDERALVHAAHLGMAMQLTNICRDVAEDFARGRMYLPLDAAAATPRAGSLSPEVAQRLVAEVDGLLRCADRYYDSADAGMRALGFRVALAVRTARFVYAAIGGEIRRRGLDVLAGRAVVPAGTKLRLVARALAASLRELPWRIGRPVRAGHITAARRFDDVLLA